ncbi:MAG TPA: undecaprenyldiphospho-muramoylpentapeptide beta-N-acetylglucosaminyltransferase [Dokdonella sp.]|nr:undecaprenyldiphospho-muramoylpentapeptide beta-N-acetylglucosaminyltransferase [Dokdonella sp.]HUD43209.1 undecaprenyldiphospho-muramoylpentapeptide beta-N-acetylglucosaminyltransferase [Dokdonella sp.]
MSAATAPVLIMAGGTGGHIFPGIAVGAELRARGVPVVWLGGRIGLEQRLVPAAGFPLQTLGFGGVRGKGLATRLLALPRLFGAWLAARRLLHRLRPRSVLALGGYASAPGGLAARSLRLPLVVHEQNRVPGMTNRLLARHATRLLSGFADAFPDGRAEWVGNPVREAIAALPEPAIRLAGRSGPLRVLVLGGSQGAQSLNGRLPAVFGRYGGALDVLHQCGAAHVEATRAAYAASGVLARVEPFIDDMAAAYAWADLAVCRSGALTVAELCAAGVPAILVPFPHAVDDHQTRNAEAMVAVGAAECVAEGEGFAERVDHAFGPLVDARDRVAPMAAAARTLARPDAARRIADICLEVAA